MAWQVGGIIERQDIMNQFVSRVKDVILNGSTVNCVENPTPVVPYQLLGSIHDLDYRLSGFGEPRGMVNAQGLPYRSIYGYLTYMTKLMLKVGVWYKHVEQTGISETNEHGRCIFSDAALLEGFGQSTVEGIPLSIPTHGVEPLRPITTQSILNVIMSCKEAYDSSMKLVYESVNISCHADCHENYMKDEGHKNSCYTGPSLASDWWGNPNCYANGSSHGYPDGRPREGHSNNYGKPTHVNNGVNTISCHTNFNRLVIKAPNDLFPYEKE